MLAPQASARACRLPPANSLLQLSAPRPTASTPGQSSIMILNRSTSNVICREPHL